MVVYAGQGDARRAMTLLWRDRGDRPEPAALGRRPELSVDLVVETAVAVADTDGMEALSMRAVSERLGRTAMSLYTYVASKNELIELMYDHAFGEPADAAEADDSPDWRTATEAWAHRLWDFYLRHPWTLEISLARPVLGPNEYRLFESLAGVLHGAGLSPARIRNTYGTLHNLVRGQVQTAAEARRAEAVTGVPEDEWWYERSALLEEVAPDFTTRFPVLSAMAEAGAFANETEDEPYLEQEARETFRSGLASVLDSLEAHLSPGTRGPRRAGPDTTPT
ncbi:TetR/AcrR family transcriptional regulator [Nocardiopsis lambiniae]|uniref:TetR/AcrR family transcriptional regulator C-terminal domain-containing protein n=1 Tax=Nocardiopsis lambiniae TaxID=3075539 RepID=A0ABU2MFR1_9ACTN|nr:TetR/AcrR family transcriptional regulator C-terminal domain-containing protein [Nocardiopsis sp. DSM 44743]MDT0331538.1 TetR/AcrR family transcriptional regulator C-terminal domain-containing protein [Nocardiopsis sp. DSM 44743]